MQNSNAWITTGMKKSCNNYRKLYLQCRERNERKLKIRYRNYCKTLSKFITAAKKCTATINRQTLTTNLKNLEYHKNNH